MYPNLYYAFKDLFGLDWPRLQIINTFGFCVAIAFLAAAYTLTKELQRREKAGWLQPVKEKLVIGGSASPMELILSFVLTFIIGGKVLGILFSWDSSSEKPLDYLLSPRGLWWAGALLAAGFTYYNYRTKKKAELPTPEEKLVDVYPHQRVADITVMAAIGGIIGAKIFNSLETWNDFVKDPIASLFGFSGLTFYGGLIVAAIVIIRYAVRKKINVWQLVDATCPGLMLAYGLGRFGCQLAGDGDWGIVNEAPKPFSWIPDWAWAYNYPHNVVNEGVPIPGCTGDYCHQLVPPVFPTPLYEIIMCLTLFVILWSIRKKITTPGLLFGIYLVMNGVERFFIEKIRVNTRDYNIFGFHPTQAEIISTLLILGGAVLIWYSKKYNRLKTTA